MDSTISNYLSAVDDLQYHARRAMELAIKLHVIIQLGASGTARHIAYRELIGSEINNINTALEEMLRVEQAASMHEIVSRETGVAA